MRIAYINNSPFYSGIGQQAYQVRRSIKELNPSYHLHHFFLDGQRGILSKNGRPISWLTTWPGPLGTKTVNWLRLGNKLNRYINHTDKKSYDGFHLTAQSLSFTVKYFKPLIVTVHDLIEVTDPQTSIGSFFNGYLHRGLRQADHIIAVSQYTAEQLLEHYGLASEMITVIHNGVSPDFFPIDNFAASIGAQVISSELKIKPAAPIVLFVGSDHPRKNLITAFKAFMVARQQIPDLIFIKVGEPGLANQRVKLLEMIDQYQLRNTVRILGKVTNQRLNELYNLASVLIFPSTHEGFGLPLLEAMAAGTPVVAADSSSIPEVVGAAACLHQSLDADQMGSSLVEIIQQPNLAKKMSAAGQARASQFTWTAAAAQTVEVYKKVFAFSHQL